MYEEKRHNSLTNVSDGLYALAHDATLIALVDNSKIYPTQYIKHTRKRDIYHKLHKQRLQCRDRKDTHILDRYT